MKYLVAVSGGVDSVVLLDMLVKEGEHELIVAHFDHGIREDSAADARFVRALAKQYGLPFTSTREELGESASEELARERRYAFLEKVARENGATIVTAHHADDVIETIAINFIRGTGWRGLAVMDRKNVIRPLLSLPKKVIYTYAVENRLEWVEDSTNQETKYLRNRVRRTLAQLPAKHTQTLFELWYQQKAVKTKLDEELRRFIKSDGEYSRYFFTNIDPKVACELLRAILTAKSHQGLTRPQLERGLLMIKTAKPGTIGEIGQGVKLHFTLRTFIVETP